MEVERSGHRCEHVAAGRDCALTEGRQIPGRRTRSAVPSTVRAQGPTRPRPAGGIRREAGGTAQLAAGRAITRGERRGSPPAGPLSLDQ
jgi:hypothetical protein